MEHLASARVAPSQLELQRLQTTQSKFLGNLQSTSRKPSTQHSAVGTARARSEPTKLAGASHATLENKKTARSHAAKLGKVRALARTMTLHTHNESKYNISRINIIHEDKRQPRFIIPWDSQFRRAWDLLAVFFVLYLSFTVPIDIAFDGAWGFPTWINTIMDVYFYTDILLNFRTGFVHNGHHITDPKLIREHYLNTWFLVDVLASIPFEAVLGGLFDKSARKSLKFLKWLKFPKLLRVSRFIRFLKGYVKFYHIFVVTCTLAFLIHLLGSLFAGATNPCIDPLQLDADGNSIVYCTFEQIVSYYISAVYVALLMCFNVLDGSKFTNYGSFPSMALNNTSNNGHTSLAAAPAALVNEKVAVRLLPEWLGLDSEIWASMSMVYLFSALGIVIGFSLVTQIIAELVTFSIFRSQGYRNFYSKVHRCKAEMVNANLPEQIMYKVSRYYDYLWINNKVGMSEKRHSIIHDHDLSLQLRKEIALAMHGSLVSQVSIFDECSEDCRADICMRLSFHIYLPGDVIFKKGDAATELFIIRKGTVAIEIPADLATPKAAASLPTTKGLLAANAEGSGAVSASGTKYMGAGSFFGELALLTSMPRSCTAQADTVAELCELSKADFHEVMIKFPELSQEVVEEMALEYPEKADEIALYCATMHKERLPSIVSPAHHKRLSALNTDLLSSSAAGGRAGHPLLPPIRGRPSNSSESHASVQDLSTERIGEMLDERVKAMEERILSRLEQMLIPVLKQHND